MFIDGIDIAFVVDIETTGLDTFRNEILTLSISAVRIETLEELDSAEFSFKPEYKQFWSDEAEKIHGISWEESLAFPDKLTEWKKVLAFMMNYCSAPQIMVCHALWMGKYFDSNFIDCQLDLLGLLFEKRKYVKGTISTISMAKDCVKMGLISTNSFKLNVLCDIYGIGLNHHDAKSDRMACQELFKIFYKNGAIDDNCKSVYLPRQESQENENNGKNVTAKKGNSKPSNHTNME